MLRSLAFFHLDAGARMQLLQVLATLSGAVLSLFGAGDGGTTVLHRTRIDGVDLLHSRSTVHGNVARFECLRSASGRCHYVVDARACATTPVEAASNSVRCRSASARQFSLAVGDSRRITGLHAMRICVGRDGAAAARECQAPVAVASAH